MEDLITKVKGKRTIRVRLTPEPVTMKPAEPQVVFPQGQTIITDKPKEITPSTIVYHVTQTKIKPKKKAVRRRKVRKPKK